MSDWAEKENRDKTRKRLREFPARRVQVMTPKSSFRVIVQPIASSLTPVGRTWNSSVTHSWKWPETWARGTRGRHCSSLKMGKVEKVSDSLKLLCRNCPTETSSTETWHSVSPSKVHKTLWIIVFDSFLVLVKSSIQCDTIPAFLPHRPEIISQRGLSISASRGRSGNMYWRKGRL